MFGFKYKQKYYCKTNQFNMTQSAKTLIAIDPEALQEIERKLDQILAEKPAQNSKPELEWLPNKKFMEEVSIKSYNTFCKIRDKMPEDLTREINGKHYIHREAVKKYFQGEFSS